MKKNHYSLSFLIILSFLVLAACSGAPAAQKDSTNTLGQPVAQVAATQAPTQQAAPALPQAGLLSTYQSVFENIYTQVNPSVVNIQVVEQQTASPVTPSIPGFTPFGSPNQSPQVSQALGSGFVWDKQGDIVTNNHVISGASQIQVTFSDGTTVSGKVIGADLNSDLAVVKVDVPADKLQPVEVADSNAVKVGQIAIAIGNPYGLQGTMTAGIISALGRELPVGEGNIVGPTYQIPDIIQTDAPINPGNSGGVLVDDQGRLIGVTAAIDSPVQANSGIGFVIPSSIVEKVIPALIKNGHYDHPYLGITGTTLTPDLAQAMNLNVQQRGALVVQVAQGGPSAAAGLQGSTNQVTINGQQFDVGGDVIVAIDGQPVNSMDDLIANLENSTTVGQKVTLTVLRNGSQQTLDVTLGARPSTQSAATPQAQASPNTPSTAGVWLGIVATSVTSGIANAMNLPSNQQGVLVEQVESGSPANQAGLIGSSKSANLNGQQVMVGGDIITAIDNQTVTSLQDLQSYLAQAQVGQQVSLTILRNGQSMQVSVTLAARPAQLP